MLKGDALRVMKIIFYSTLRFVLCFNGMQLCLLFIADNITEFGCCPALEAPGLAVTYIYFMSLYVIKASKGDFKV